MISSSCRVIAVGLPVTFRRCLRGGSWNNNSDNARAANRNNNHPNNRNNNVGFRVCCASHIFLPSAMAQVRQFTGRRACCGRFNCCQHGSASGIGRRPWFAVRGAVIKMAQVSPGCTDILTGIRRPHTEARRLLGTFIPEAPHFVFSHPPSNRPSSATMALTWRYWPSFSHRQRWARRR